MGDHSSVDVDAVVKNSVQPQEQRNGGPPICTFYRGKQKTYFAVNPLRSTRCRVVHINSELIMLTKENWARNGLGQKQIQNCGK